METTELIALIVKRRKSLGITQEKLAELSKTDQARISAYERGEVEPGIAITLRLLAAVRLEVDLAPSEELDELN